MSSCARASRQVLESSPQSARNHPNFALGCLPCKEPETRSVGPPVSREPQYAGGHAHLAQALAKRDEINPMRKVDERVTVSLNLEDPLIAMPLVGRRRFRPGPLDKHRNRPVIVA